MKIKQKLRGIAIIALLIVIVPVVILATNENTNNIQIVKIEQAKYILYINELQNKEFNYAISDSNSVEELELKYIHSLKDEEGNQVALIDESVYNLNNGTKAYLWVKEGANAIISAQEIDFSHAFEKTKMEEVEKTTKRIKTQIVKDLVEEDRIDDKGVHITVSVGGIKIKDNKKAEYFYQAIPATGKYETMMSLAETLKNEYDDNMSMYTRISTTNEFYNIYNELLEKAKWQKVEEMTIKQPKEAKEGSKYVVLIKKVDGDNITFDAQFLTCQEKQIPKYVKEKIITQETTKLPITGDSFAIIIVFALVILATVLVFIRMKKLNNENNGKKD